MLKMGIKEKAVGASGSVSGIASVLGSWQICHNACIGLIALLSILGITLTGMPLAFLTTIAIPLWSVAAFLWLVTLYLYKTKKCISLSLLTINTGLITTGIPFQALQPFKYFFWGFGGIITITGIVLWIKGRKHRRCHHEHK